MGSNRDKFNIAFVIMEKGQFDQILREFWVHQYHIRQLYVDK